MKYNTGDIIKLIDPSSSDISLQYINCFGIIIGFLNKENNIQVYLIRLVLVSLRHGGYYARECDLCGIS